VGRAVFEVGIAEGVVKGLFGLWELEGERLVPLSVRPLFSQLLSSIHRKPPSHMGVAHVPALHVGAGAAGHSGAFC
jgi:hypothetical protein